MNATTTTTTTTATTTATGCKCGCGRPTNNTYAPGHDARHVSLMIKEVMDKGTSREAARAQLPSVALQIKFDNAITNAINKAIARIEREEAKLARKEAKRAAKEAKSAAKETKTKTELIEITEVKVGRWWYPIAQITDEVIVYTKRDGSEATTRLDAKVR
jgi:hypothetical protein